jgi:glycogen debranching enzyme
MEKTEESFEQLWDPFSAEYFSRDFVTHHFLKESSIAALMPLYAGCIDQKRADILVRALENEHRFGPAFPVPSVPLDSPWFKNKTYWQGPTWINMNWLIIDGLKRYGYKDHAAALREITLELVNRSGFYEYFDPVTGEPAGAPEFSWTAALTIDLYRRK